MKTLLTAFRESLARNANALLWQQWSCLGVPGYGVPPSPYTIDLEALVLATSTIGRRDPRLFDEALDWLNLYNHALSTQRLKSLLHQQMGDSGSTALSGIAAYLQDQGNNSAKWRTLSPTGEAPSSQRALFLKPDGTELPAFGQADPSFRRAGFQRGVVQLRNHAQRFDPALPACFTLKMRALFGANTRADIMTYLVTHPQGANASVIARQIGYSQRSVHETLTAMSDSRLIHEILGFGDKPYRLNDNLRDGILAGTTKSPHWLLWPRAWLLLTTLFTKLEAPAFAALSPESQASVLRAALDPIFRIQVDPDDLVNRVMSPVQHKNGDDYLQELSRSTDVLFKELKIPQERLPAGTRIER